jgi:hypothetical protein
MPTYTLTIQMDSTGVSDIQTSKQYVTLAKAVSNDNGPSLPVVWLAITPGETNVVTWTEEYSVYASTTNYQDGAQISTSSTLPAVGGTTYNFENGVFSVASTSGIESNQYGVNNQDSAMQIEGVSQIVSGLYQGSVLNGESSSSPLNAALLPYNENATFTPVEMITVFLSGFSDNGFVLTEISGNPLVVDFTHSTEQTVYFSDSSNQFFLGTLPPSLVRS